MKQLRELRFDLAASFLAGVALMVALAYGFWHQYARPDAESDS